MAGYRNDDESRSDQSDSFLQPRIAVPVEAENLTAVAESEKRIARGVKQGKDVFVFHWNPNPPSDVQTPYIHLSRRPAAKCL
jgi:hypothetical protein